MEETVRHNDEMRTFESVLEEFAHEIMENSVDVHGECEQREISEIVAEYAPELRRLANIYSDDEVLESKTDEQNKKVLEILTEDVYTSECGHYDDEGDEYVTEYDKIYIDGNVSYKQMARIVDYLRGNVCKL